MRVRATPDLAQLADHEFFAEIQEGTALCLSNANRIHDDHVSLTAQKRVLGAEILRLAAEEEAAKVLILLDAVRCPRARLPEEFRRQLQYFNDHLAKGIYTQYCDRKPLDLTDAKRWVDRERKEFYLDGPNDVDWIFYNEILRAREETIYVDFVENDGQHVWHDPTVLDEIRLPFVMPRKNPVLRLVNALSDVGCLLSPALDIIAQIWRPLVLDDNFSAITLRDWNVKTLEAMDQRGVLRARTDEVYAVIVSQWLFPLWPLDLRKDPVDKSSLREIQQRWSPEP